MDDATPDRPKDLQGGIAHEEAAAAPASGTALAGAAAAAAAAADPVLAAAAQQGLATAPGGAASAAEAAARGVQAAVGAEVRRRRRPLFTPLKICFCAVKGCLRALRQTVTRSAARPRSSLSEYHKAQRPVTSVIRRVSIGDPGSGSWLLVLCAGVQGMTAAACGSAGAAPLLSPPGRLQSCA